MSKKQPKKEEPVVSVKQTTAYVSKDGELLSENVNETIPVGKEPQYFKVYLQDLGNIMGLTPAEKTVFYSLCRSMAYSGIVVLIKVIKEMLIKETGYSFETIRSAVKGLTKKNFLIRRARSVYQVNPKYCAKGEWADIKAMRIEIAYSELGRKVVVKKVPKSNNLQVESSTDKPVRQIEDAQAEEIKEDKDTEEAEKQRPEMWTDLPDDDPQFQAFVESAKELWRKGRRPKEQNWTKPNPNAKEIPFAD